ncbi:MAG: CoA-acylating methylmalonate-semialdehyde dehydrogenase [Thermoplasmata archaeon]|nr:CoA-acylating methylmalonate-semialdehyde dehydrogenase [Thermoplasmata archaeon]MCI4361569.1 CoA-acylating methylmalonate-semialdehyde dehydrogenase [Thermoplasmata archaeon]
MTGARDLTNRVAGRPRSSAGTGRLDVRNPATGEVIGTVPLSGAEDVAAAVAAARAAFPAWSSTPVGERGRLVGRFRALLERDQESLARSVVREHGKTMADAAGSVRRGIESVEFAEGAASLLPGATIANTARGVDAEMFSEPLGVVVGITPFNFPVMVPLWMFPTAIALGNTFVLKPSERVPLSADLLGALSEEAGFPPGVLNIVHGDKDAVNALLVAPGVDAVAFVGSAPVARHIYTTAAAAGKRVLALAGAKNHLVVLPDADVPGAVDSILSSAFGSAGERCLAGSVVLAVDPIGDELVRRLSERVRALKVGPGDDPSTDVGPVVRPEQRDRVESYIRLGQSEGATVAAQAPVPAGSGGYFVAPTLFDHVRPSMRIAREEIFGPVLAVVRVASFEEALEVANASEFGNAAAIYTRDGGRARAFRERIQAGMVGVNLGVPAPSAALPFVGWKGSAYGALAATGPEAVRFFTRTKVVMSRWPAEPAPRPPAS